VLQVAARSDFKRSIQENAWESEFRATGAMRGISWVGLYQDTANGHLMNFGSTSMMSGTQPAGYTPLLVMDVFEHTFMLDCGLKRAVYIDAFFANIDRQLTSRG
jgi:Fe-Mn family superoxide dismutase